MDDYGPLQPGDFEAPKVRYPIILLYHEGFCACLDPEAKAVIMDDTTLLAMHEVGGEQ